MVSLSALQINRQEAHGKVIKFPEKFPQVDFSDNAHCAFIRQGCPSTTPSAVR